MDKGGTLDLAETDLPSADEKEDRRQVGAATLVAAASYGISPLNVSFAKAAAIEAEASLIKQLDGMENFISASSLSSVVVKSRFEQEKEQEEKTLQLVASAVAEIESQRQRELEREEWSRSLHSFGRIEMTGAEWQSFSDALRGDTELRRWLVERARLNGHSEAEAQDIADEVADIGNIMAIPESQRTPAQRQRLEAANNNPEFRNYMDAVAAQHKKRESGQSNDRESSVRTGSMAASVAGGADELTGFVTAPDMKTHYAKVSNAEATSPNAPSTHSQRSVPASPTLSGFEN